MLKTVSLTPMTLRATVPSMSLVTLLIIDSERVTLSGVAPTTIRTVPRKV
jgi:hypothetical protein